MAAQKPKSRMISLRVSDDEYVGLKQACVINGWSNVSEAARAAFKILLRGDGEKCVPVQVQVEQLTGQMDLLGRKVEMLAEKLEAVSGVGR